jgi:hypothetical protein
MIEALPAPDHVAAFRVAGIANASDYDEVIPAIEKKLQQHDSIAVLADLTELEDITAAAVRRDIQYGLNKLGELHRFKRAGVISDKQWVKAAAGLTDALFPELDARVFSADEKQEALRWVSAAE